MALELTNKIIEAMNTQKRISDRPLPSNVGTVVSSEEQQMKVRVYTNYFAELMNKM